MTNMYLYIHTQFTVLTVKSQHDIVKAFTAFEVSIITIVYVILKSYDDNFIWTLTAWGGLVSPKEASILGLIAVADT